MATIRYHKLEAAQCQTANPLARRRAEGVSCDACSYPKLLRAIEDAKGDLGVLSYGLTCTTLEEVFMAASKAGPAQQEAEKEPVSATNDTHVDVSCPEPSERLQVPVTHTDSGIVWWPGFGRSKTVNGPCGLLLSTDAWLWGACKRPGLAKARRP